MTSPHQIERQRGIKEASQQLGALRERQGSVAIRFPEQLRRPRDVDGDPPRLVFRQHLRLPRLVLAVAGVEVRERLAVGVPDDVPARNLVDAPGRREAAGWFCHGLRATVAGNCYGPTKSSGGCS
jgi:hypothetical protein